MGVETRFISMLQSKPLSGPLTLVRLSCPGGLTEFKYVTYTPKTLRGAQGFLITQSGSHSAQAACSDPTHHYWSRRVGTELIFVSPFGVSKLKKNTFRPDIKGDYPLNLS